MTTALVLSAGGMFGAYQAGVWKSLARVFQPDLVVGTSAGSLNGWAIAGGCTAEELTAIWLDPALEKLMRVRWRASMWLGLWDPAPLAESIQALHARYRPRIPFVLTVTEVPRMKPGLVRGEDVTWQHLAASCAVPFGFPPVRIGGKLYADGGLLAVLPVWAAAECGATRAVAVNALPVMPSRVVRTAARLAYHFGRNRLDGKGIDVMEISRRDLGSLSDAMHWSVENARRWIELGEEDGAKLAPRLASERAVPLK
jgi:NTE family protein